MLSGNLSKEEAGLYVCNPTITPTPESRFDCSGREISLPRLQVVGSRYGSLQVARLARDVRHSVRLFNEEIENHVCPGKITWCFDAAGFSAYNLAELFGSKTGVALKDTLAKGMHE